MGRFRFVISMHSVGSSTLRLINLLGSQATSPKKPRMPPSLRLEECFGLAQFLDSWPSYVPATVLINTRADVLFPQPLLILFLFCSPSLDNLFDIYSPQPFVNIYQQALGKGGGMVMSIVAIVGLFIVSADVDHSF